MSLKSVLFFTFLGFVGQTFAMDEKPKTEAADGPLNYDPIRKRFHFGPALQNAPVQEAQPLEENDNSVAYKVGEEDK